MLALWRPLRPVGVYVCASCVAPCVFVKCYTPSCMFVRLASYVCLARLGVRCSLVYKQRITRYCSFVACGRPRWPKAWISSSGSGFGCPVTGFGGDVASSAATPSRRGWGSLLSMSLLKRCSGGLVSPQRVMHHSDNVFGEVHPLTRLPSALRAADVRYRVACA